VFFFTYSFALTKKIGEIVIAPLSLKKRLTGDNKQSAKTKVPNNAGVTLGPTFQNCMSIFRLIKLDRFELKKNFCLLSSGM
jgi:hypothetical protein